MTHHYYEQYWSDEGYGPEGGLAPTTREMLDEFVPRASRVVDVGCGDGRAVGLWAKSRGCDYLGLDISANAVTMTRSLGLTAERVEDASQLPLPDGDTPVLTAIEVLEHLFDPLAAVREFYRVLTPGGLFIASVPNSAYWVRRLELGLLGRFNPYGHDRSATQPWIDPHVRFFTRGSLRAMLGEAGYRPVELRGGAHLVFSLRTRVEAVPLYRALMLRWPAMLAPALLVAARKPAS